ncbi:hypothetical protein K431DRAFT_259687 [Polychaeton citri CBS 116435]|uniref:peptidylprolyl isomerase n=1 Tax=Polychaeton citri CBS 116435 TaxID=1314669 RepID=A0A9P4QGL7_9PEZI|nr:hypothetical protein K431DRAFT_259687 [Polychaeton citri CBS 116435]
MASTSRPRVFLDVSVGEEHAGRLTVELFTDKTPRTCENFRQLCTGEHNNLSYALSPFHRVIDEFMIQGGDITKGDGTGGESVYGGEFEDENLRWRDMDASGLVCSANRGRDTNGSQFFVTLEPCPHLNGKHTIFGRLVGGQDTLMKVAAVDVDENDRPRDAVLVSRCGELERKKNAHNGLPAARGQATEATSRDASDRGRRRKSDHDASGFDTDTHMQIDEEAVPVTKPHRRSLGAAFNRARRQSDNVIDEGLRGRPRLRSGSRSPSAKVVSSESASDGDDSVSPASKHKRKRSPSPSRHDRRDADDRTFERRRRSLPNQYARDRPGRAYEEEDRYRPSPRRDDQYRRNDDNSHRRDDRYRPDRSRRDRYENNDGRLGDTGGRLGGDDAAHRDGPPVKFKGRGFMKYREPNQDHYGRL